MKSKMIIADVLSKWEITYEISNSLHYANLEMKYKPFLMIRWWSGDPEYERRPLVRTSLLVSVPGVTWTNGNHEKNCLKPLRNLKNKDVI